MPDKYIMTTNKSISYLALLSGLSISIVAIYYSVSGLVSIFSGAMIPIIIMGTVLEVSKLIATVWIKQYWNIAPLTIKTYLVTAIIILMLITSLGIFGFLSRAHLESSASAGDLTEKIALVDEKIKIQQDIVDTSRKSLSQLNSAVDQTLERSTSEKGAARSIKVRKSQQNERDFLQKSIQDAQTQITAFNVEKAPLNQQLRKEKVEFGPITYIAALLYEDSEKNLENAVRYVIILIVVVFDPLAVILLLCSQYSFNYIREQRQLAQAVVTHEPQIEVAEVIDEHDDSSDDLEQQLQEYNTELQELIEEVEEATEEPVVEPTIEEDLEVEEPTDEEVEIPTDESIEEKTAKNNWKAAHPNDTIKRQYRLLKLGLIDKLPWN